MKKTLILTAAFACAAFTANATVLFESNWSTWTTAYQTAYNSGNGSLIADVGSTGGVDLGITGGNPLTSGPAAMLDTSLYSFTYFPTFTFSNADSWTGVTSLILEIGYGGTSNELAPIAFTYNGGATLAPVVDFVDNGEGGGMMDAARFVNTYTWSFSEPTNLADFNIVFNTIGGHTSYGYFNVSAIAVPEPSTYALVAGAFGLAAVVVARRRRRA